MIRGVALEVLRRIQGWTDVVRLERNVQRAIERLQAPLPTLRLTEADDGAALRVNTWHTIEVTDAETFVTFQVPPASESQTGDLVALTFVSGQGVAWIEGFVRGGIIAAAHDALHTAWLRYNGEEWCPLAGGLLWNDVKGPAVNGLSSTALSNAKYRDTEFVTPIFSGSGSGERISFTYQMPHGWARTAVRPHIHYIPLAASGGAAYFEARYAWSLTGSGQVVPADASWATVSATETITAAQQYTEQAVSFGVIEPPAWADASSHLLIDWARFPANVADTYGDIALLSFDTHAQITHDGSFVEFPT